MFHRKTVIKNPQSRRGSEVARTAVCRFLSRFLSHSTASSAEFNYIQTRDFSRAYCIGLYELSLLLFKLYSLAGVELRRPNSSTGLI